MTIRRCRLGSLALCWLACLWLSSERVCRAADGERSFPRVDSMKSPLITQRPSPFFDEDQPAASPRSPRVQRVTSQRDQPAAPAVEEGESLSPAGIIGDLEPAELGKTPLPEASGTDAPANAPSPRGRSGFGSSVAWAVGILAAGWVGRQVLKSSGPLSRGSPSAVEVLSRQTLGPQQQLAVLRFGQRVLLIGTTPTGMSTLATVEDPAEVRAIVSELRPPLTQVGPTLFDLFRSRQPERARDNAPVNVALSTDPRPRAPERPSTAKVNREVADV